MFLQTLGFKKNNNSILKSRLSSADTGRTVDVVDRRGKHVPGNKLGEDTVSQICEHIESYCPSLPHYRRVHSPNRRYLPSDLTVTQMVKDFNETHENHVSRETYRKRVKEMNIAFTKLSGEECETCTMYFHHTKNNSHDSTTCDLCQGYSAHKERYVRARQEYEKDKMEQKNEGQLLFSADLMKVTMIPKMPHKVCIFTPRVIAFNQTFSPIGAATKPGLAVVWDESTAGRNKEDIASTFVHFVQHFRDATEITLFVDNCAAQNKNWYLFGILLQCVHQRNVALQIIRLKYLETGHTFMSADCDHSTIEKQLNSSKSVLDIDDFAMCCTTNRITGKILTASDFLSPREHHYVSQYRLNNLSSSSDPPKPLLADVVVAEFRRNTDSMFFKFSFEGEFIEYKAQDLMKKKFKPLETLTEPFTLRSTSRGICSAKKTQIIQKLLPLMPEHRRDFWISMPDSDISADLISSCDWPIFCN